MHTRADQAASIRADKRFWLDLAAAVGPDRYAEPGPMGEWSFADMAGHLLGWRNRTIARLEAFARGDPEPAEPWPADILDEEAEVDRVNAWIQAGLVGRAPEALVAAYAASYDRLLAALEAIPDATLTDPDALPWAGGPLVEVDFTGHLHEEHVPAVRAWLDAR
jgi:hypothetical protein